MDYPIERNFSLKGKTALVTGASSGIGEAIAECYAAAGSRLVICGRRFETVEEAAKRLRETGADVLALAANIANDEDRKKLVAEAMAWSGRIDILVNNAGANPAMGALENLEEKDLDVVLNVNFKGILFLSQEVFRAWMGKNGGNIINISSIGGSRCMHGISGYCAVKAGLNHLGRCMAAEWGKYGIRVNTIAPGIIQTKFSKALWENQQRKENIKLNPIPRFGTIEDTIGTALLLASDASAYITGQNFVVDGGYLISGTL